MPNSQDIARLRTSKASANWCPACLESSTQHVDLPSLCRAVRVVAFAIYQVECRIIWRQQFTRGDRYSITYKRLLVIVRMAVHSASIHILSGRACGCVWETIESRDKTYGNNSPLGAVAIATRPNVRYCQLQRQTPKGVIATNANISVSKGTYLEESKLTTS